MSRLFFCAVKNQSSMEIAERERCQSRAASSFAGYASPPTAKPRTKRNRGFSIHPRFSPQSLSSRLHQHFYASSLQPPFFTNCSFVIQILFRIRRDGVDLFPRFRLQDQIAIQSLARRKRRSLAIRPGQNRHRFLFVFRLALFFILTSFPKKKMESTFIVVCRSYVNARSAKSGFCM
jgi:hypothetical protein